MNTEMKKAKKQNVSLKGIQNLFFRTQLILIITLALMLGIAGTVINIRYETQKRDNNLQNVAETIARSPILSDMSMAEDDVVLLEYLDTLKESLNDIDVISVVNNEGLRIYHSNPALIGTQYDGNLPDFKNGSIGTALTTRWTIFVNSIVVSVIIYDKDGECVGVVMAIMLMKNIKNETTQMLLIFLVITLGAIFIEIVFAISLSRKVKKGLMGYEPDVFTAMYKMRDNILETLKEGIIAINDSGIVQFANEAAVRMLCEKPRDNIVGKHINELDDEILTATMMGGSRAFNVHLSKANIILDRISIKESDGVTGAIGILHDRAEYTKLMEDLSGTRYLVDSMRANNHDFTNKLHVILGLIQMEMYDDAMAYIQNITMVQRETISKVMNAVSEPAVAALLIGKIARAAELNIKFVLRDGCYYSSADMNLPSEMMVTVIGNLLDNAFESMNSADNISDNKELMFGIYSRPGAVLITVDDTGKGIKEEDIERIFVKGYSTKGEGRGTGLDQVKTMVESFGGKITVESQEGVGSSFSVSFTKEK